MEREYGGGGDHAPGMTTAVMHVILAIVAAAFALLLSVGRHGHLKVDDGWPR